MGTGWWQLCWISGLSEILSGEQKYLNKSLLLRQLIPRSRLGPDLVFVVLDMTLEQQMDRIRGRHDNDEAAVEMMKVGTFLFGLACHKPELNA